MHDSWSGLLLACHCPMVMNWEGLRLRFPALPIKYLTVETGSTECTWDQPALKIWCISSLLTNRPESLELGVYAIGYQAIARR